MIHGTLLDDMNQSNDKIQSIDRSRAPLNVPQQSYGTRAKISRQLQNLIDKKL